MSTSLTEIALSGLRASQIGLATTGNNITNVNTPGYTRQEALFAAAVPQFTGGGYLGSGVNVQSVRRVYVAQLGAQAMNAASDAAFAAAGSDALGRLNTLVSSADNGVSPAISAFFASADALSASPADSAARQAFLSDAGALAHGITDTQDLIGQERSAVNGDIQSAVDAVNQDARAIAKLNASIAAASVSGQPPNDLLDQRDTLLTQLAQQVRVQTFPQSDGSINVSIGTGQALVTGASAFALKMVPDEFRSDAPVVGTQSGNFVTPLPSGDLIGGALGGLLSYRDQALSAATAGLGRLAVALAAAVNAQNRAGVDASGAAGQDVFSVDAPTAVPSSGNAGGAALGATVTDASALAASDYQVSWDGSAWSVLRSSDGSRQSFSTLPATVDGLQISVQGTPSPGDAFLVSATRPAAQSISVALTRGAQVAAGRTAASGDGNNAAAIAALAGANAVQGSTPIGAWSALVADIGARGHEAGLAKTATASLASSLSSARDAAAGVNLDEEAMNLTRYQQAFQASGKLAAVAGTLFDAILQIAR